MDEKTFVFKRAVRAVWFAAVIAALLAAVDRPSPQLVAFAFIVLISFIASTRARVVVRDGVLYRRGLLGWESNPMLLEELAKLTLRREASNRYFQRELKLIRSDGSESSFECWAWENWRELAHLSWHAAKTTGAQVDEASRQNFEALCPPGCDITVPRVLGRRAPPLVDQRMTLREFLLLLPASAVFGFTFGTGAAWLRDDPEFRPEWQMGLVFAGIFVGLAAAVALWDVLGPSNRAPSD